MNHLNLPVLRDVNFLVIFDHLSNELRYMFWEKYPFMCLSLSFHLERLVELIMPYRNIKQLRAAQRYYSVLFQFPCL